MKTSVIKGFASWLTPFLLRIFFIRKIAIENLAILQTGDLPAILRCRHIFALHRILPLSPSMRGIKGEGSSQKWIPPRLAVNLPVSPKINVYF